LLGKSPDDLDLGPNQVTQLEALARVEDLGSLLAGFAPDCDIRCAVHQRPIQAVGVRRVGDAQVILGCELCLGPEESWVSGWSRLF
jgi:hypothetical protein